MKHLFILLTTVLLTTSSYAQITFEKGYFIDNEGKKTDCLIRNADWKSNPSKIQYKLNETSDKIEIGIDKVAEFGIDNTSKYIRSHVYIDRSSDLLGKLSNKKKAEFKQEQLFLKVLLEGKASLYLYEHRSLVRFFYAVNQGTIKQLIYKRYRTANNQIGKNFEYKQQLWTELKCSTVTLDDIKTIRYYKNDLVKYFIKYNSFHKQETMNFERQGTRKLFKLNLQAGVGHSRFSINNANNTTGMNEGDFESKTRFKFGIEAEVLMPFNKNKWAIFIAPTYQSFSSELGNNIVWTAKYNSIEAPVGIRHSFFLNEQSRLFVNGGYVLDLSFKDSGIKASNGNNLLSLKAPGNMFFGLGYKHKNKVSVELRYQANRELLHDYIDWNSKFNTISILFGYSIY